MKNYIENFDDFKFPEIELSKEEIVEIKEVVIRKGMLNAIKKLIKYNTKVNIDFTEEEILKIYREVQATEISKDKGSKDRIFLRTLVIKSLDREVLQRNKSIVKSALLYNPYSMKIPYWFQDKYYTKLYLTEDKIIKYEITNSFDVVSKEEIPLNQIIYAAVEERGRKFWTIKLKYRDISWPVKKDYVSVEFGEFIKALNKMGIPDK